MCGFVKKILPLAVAAILMCGCGKPEPVPVLSDGESDMEYIQNKGTFIIGITDFAPMDFQEDGKWEGFDANLAEAFAAELGVVLEFKEIDWEKKTALLFDGTIDCIWNGMTLTEELMQEIDCSDAYLSNEQVIVMHSDMIDEYASAKDCQHLLFAAEAGSTGEELLKELKYRYASYDTQKEALRSVLDNKTDAAVIDIIMAGYYTADGKEFGKLGFKIPLNNEEIGVGLRKNSDLTGKLNEFLAGAAADGTMNELAELYGITEAVIPR